MIHGLLVHWEFQECFFFCPRARLSVLDGWVYGYEASEQFYQVGNYLVRIRLGLPPADYVHNIFVRHGVTQPDSLRDMSRTGTPYQGVLEGLLERPVDPITHVLNGTVAPHNQSLAEIRVGTLALGVDADEVELLPAAIDDVLDAQVELAAHDDGLGLAGQLIEEVERHAVDLVVDVEAVDVLAVVLHDDVDEVVHGGVLIADQDLAVEDLVVAEDGADHFLVEVFGRGLERDLHAAGFFGLEVDVPTTRDYEQKGGRVPQENGIKTHGG